MKNALLNIFIVLSIISFTQCTHQECDPAHEKNREEAEKFRKIVQLHQQLDRAIQSNDSMLYNDLASFCLLHNMGEHLFYYSLVMANKYNSAEGSYHVYDILTNTSQKKQTTDTMDNRSKNMALYYLFKAHELGYPSAEYAINEIFPDSTKRKNAEFYLKKFSENEKN